MRRLLRITVDVHAPGEGQEQTCVEVFVTSGRGAPNRLLHFGVDMPWTEEDVDFVGSRIEEVTTALMARTLGIQQKLS